MQRMGSSELRLLKGELDRRSGAYKGAELRPLRVRRRP